MKAYHPFADTTFSVLLVILAPIAAGAGMQGITDGDTLAALAGGGMLLGALMLFGMGCMGLNRMKEFFGSR